MTDFERSLGTNSLAELDGAEVAGWVEGTRLKKSFPGKEGVHLTQVIRMPSTVQEDNSEEFEEFEVETVARQKYI